MRNENRLDPTTSSSQFNYYMNENSIKPILLTKCSLTFSLKKNAH